MNRVEAFWEVRSQIIFRMTTGIVVLGLLVCSIGSTCNVTTGANNNTPGLVGTPGSNNNGTPGGTVLSEKPPLNADDHILGDSNAPVTIIEYADFQCPFCGRFAREEFATLKANYIDTGKVRWVFRHFPLRNIHARAESAARASECANDQSSFFPYLDLTFATVDGTNATILTDTQLQQNAAMLGLNTTQFNACFPPGTNKATRVQQDVDSGTPTFFVDNERYTGFKTAAELGAVIERRLGN